MQLIIISEKGGDVRGIDHMVVECQMYFVYESINSYCL